MRFSPDAHQTRKHSGARLSANAPSTHRVRSFSKSSPVVYYLDARLRVTLNEVDSVQHRPDLLLAELHAHSTWSDGALSIPEVVDLYGEQGFDVLCITDHVHPPDDHWAHLGVSPDRFGEYVAEIESEAERALERYALLLVPGAELAINHADPDLAAHAVAVGLRSYVSLAEGLELGLSAARNSVETGHAVATPAFRRPGAWPSW